MSGDAEEFKREFRQWMETEGQAEVGGIIKDGARRERDRLTERLENGSLFPHIEHEDRVALDKAERAEAHGQSLVDRYRRRRKGMKKLREAINT